MHERKAHVEYVPDLEQLARKKRVCAYARVSSDKDEAFHSLSAQISYYQTVIAKRPDWEFAGVFSDLGITGTKDNRPGFQEMLEACRAHKVDIVLAKSITRFARNTVILLETVRELRSLGIDIHFEEERIETLSVGGEFMISVLAARAQEESRSASENQKWRIRKCFERGEPVTGNCLGYRMVNHQFLIDTEEEKTVLRIFSMYLSGMGKVSIAKKLNTEGVKNCYGKVHWTEQAIHGILCNEKYCGDLKLYKAYRLDYVTKKKKVNKGERVYYYIKNDHDPIISREVFEKVQQEIKDRATRHNQNKEVKKTQFSGLIRCAVCGDIYCRKTANSSTKYAKPAWTCRTSNKFGKAFCDASSYIIEKELVEKTCKVLNVESLDNLNLRDKIKQIEVSGRTLVYTFTDGSQTSIEWSYPSRSKSWTPEMKEKARQKTMLYWQEKKEEKNGS